MAEEKKEAIKEEKTEKNDEGGEEGKGKEDSGIGALFSPEGIMIMSIAAFFDVIGLIPVVGDVSDVFAMIILGLWALFSDRLITIWKKKAVSAILTFVVTAILEAIPIVSDITPIISLLGITFNQPITVSWTGWTFWVFKNS